MASEAAAAAAEASFEMLQDTDIEELEVTETDVALLREILEEPYSGKEELEKDSLKQRENSEDDDKHGRIWELNEELNNDVDGFDCCWPDEMVEMRPTSPPVVDETMAWYVGAAEFSCNIDYSQLYSGVFFEEETTYGCLWQD
ncbi:hypothetical protein PTKIN_Ptkin15bG0175400 [Pterospermum kingtungense]